ERTVGQREHEATMTNRMAIEHVGADRHRELGADRHRELGTARCDVDDSHAKPLRCRVARIHGLGHAPRKRLRIVRAEWHHSSLPPEGGWARDGSSYGTQHPFLDRVHPYPSLPPSTGT